MKKYEGVYFQVLICFSKFVCQLCEVSWVGDEYYVYVWVDGVDVWFCYMDLMDVVVFMLDMVEVLLDMYMCQEVEFLVLFDQVKVFIDVCYDLCGSDLVILIVIIFQKGGMLLNNWCKCYVE